ncbi:hypothetical protein NLJ89_g5035 [Agrocybe chaxingu]|uniref:Uncharacterized protein n=1 Tax=Agrocybe chaxingu TaxID=84603 RepID=A0A9W8JZB7_9AGAR|nr:hypothetical protein NLJ89_g5035 [Agrocybe chaxingu]
MHDSHHYTQPVLLDFITHVLHTSEVPYAIVEHIIALLPRYHAYASVHYEGGITTLSGHELFPGLLVILTPYYKEKFAEKAKFTNGFWGEIAGVGSFRDVHMLHVYRRLDGVLGSLFVDPESLPNRQDVQFELPPIVV